MRLIRGAFTAALCCIAFLAAADPSIRKIVEIPIPLPKDYLPPTVPARPIDESIRVCLVPPAFDPNTSATWTAPTAWEDAGTGTEPVGGIADRIIVNFAEALDAALPRIVKRLYPRTQVSQSSFVLPQCDLQLGVSLQSHDIADSINHLQGATVNAAMTALAADGTTITTIHASSSGYRTKTVYWSNHTEARAICEPALQGMLNQLIRLLISDAQIGDYIKNKAAERARPSDLETTATFDDSASFFPNGRLDAGEGAKLAFSVWNRGAGPAFGVRLHVASPAKGITIPAETEVGDILPGATKHIAVPITGALDVESARQTLRIETLEKRGYGGRPLALQLDTLQLKKPTLEIVDISLNDGRGRAHGDGNGRPSNGETIDATIIIRNSGSGAAIGAHLTVTSVPGVEVIDSTIDMPAIAPNSVGEAHALFRLPVGFTRSDLPLTISAEETRGAQVALVSRTATWPVEIKRPALEVAYHVYDGNSRESRGDSDGVANNGETLDLAIVPMNHGSQAARDVTLKITSRLPNVTVTPDTLSIGELPAASDGEERRLRIVVPRTLGRDTLIDALPFVAAIAQRDFGPTEQAISLPFKVHRPELAATVTHFAPLIEGKTASFELELRNRGSLAAENVRVELSCENPALELFDESGVPVRKRIVDVGTVAANASSSKIAVTGRVRRGIAETAASLAIAIQQSDFLPVASQTALNIQREQEAVVSLATETPLPPDPVPEPTNKVPATIFFQRYENGERVNEAAIQLRFEVQSLSPLRTVRLEQNHRTIDPGDARAVQNQNNLSWQYEPLAHLDYGENMFEVIVVTASGAKSQRNIIINRERPQGKLWVAAVGISKYAHKGVPDLAFAREDAVSILDYYRQFGVPEEQLIQLLDEQATLANIKKSLGTDLVNKATPNDTVILYFAGHGQKESDRASSDADGYTKYLLPYDTNPADLFSSALSMDELGRVLQRLSSERVVLMIDSCFSGAAGGRTLFNPDITTRAPITDEFLARMAAAGAGRVILTASSAQEVAQESGMLRHGVFTYYLLKALSGSADVDHDGRVDIDEVYKFVTEWVSHETGGRQTPVKKAPNVKGTVIVGRTLHL